MLLRKTLIVVRHVGRKYLRYDGLCRMQNMKNHQGSVADLPTPDTTSLNSKRWTENMEETFAFPEESTNRMLLKKSVLANLDEAQMVKTKGILIKYGFPTGVIQECPDLLTLRSSALENYIIIMRETGFTSIRPFLLATYPAISRKSLTSLRKTGLIPENENVIEKYFHLLELPREIRSNILSALPINPNELSLKALRLLILEHFLTYKLDADVESCRKLISTNPRTKFRSYKWISENIQILLTEFNFTTQKILRNGTLLQGDPANYRKILNSVETLGGIPVKDLAIRRPKILLAQAESLCRMKDIFREHGIKDEAVAKHPELFTLSPDTVAQRLRVIDETPALLPFKTHPRLGRVLYYFEKVKKRLDYFSALDITGVSLHVLSLDQEKFANYVKRGDLRNKGGDIVEFLAGSLDMVRKDVRNALSVHPHWLQIPTLYAKEVLHLLEKIFTLDQLRNAIPIFLYPLAKIEEGVSAVLAENNFDEDIKKHPYFLHLVIYHLEKQYHFSGDGVWTSYHQLRHDTTEKENHQNVPP